MAVSVTSITGSPTHDTQVRRATIQKGTSQLTHSQTTKNRLFAESTIASMEKALKCLKAYYTWADETYRGRQNEPGIEAQKRVSQMIWILRKVAELQDVVSSAHELTSLPIPNISEEEDYFKSEKYKDWEKRRDAGEFREALNNSVKAVFEIEMLTESFYYFGFRARGVIRDSLDGIKNFECKGIRNVRNHLVEHPEGKSSTVTENGFGLGLEHGPVLKAIRSDGKEKIHNDQGLFVNAAEFATNLTKGIGQIDL